MSPRLALEIVDRQGRGFCVGLPDEVDERPLLIGYRGDIEVPLPGELSIVRRRGRVYVASVRHEVPVSLGGMRLPTWPVPVPVPCALALGASEVRLHAYMPRAQPAPRRSPRERKREREREAARQPPYLADRILVACVATTRRCVRALRTEWRLARVETKLAFATVLLATVLLATHAASAP